PAGLAAGPFQRVGEVPLAILKQHRSVTREAQLDADRVRLALHAHAFMHDLNLLPALADLVFLGILRIDLFDEDVGLVRADDGEAPGDAVVVAESDSGQGRLAAADHVPARCVQVYEVTQ